MGMTQEEVATALNHVKSTISRWEAGSRAVDLEDLERLAKLYGVDPVALFMSPDDVELAAQLTAAKRILQQSSAQDRTRWLDIGASVARPKEPAVS